MIGPLPSANRSRILACAMATARSYEEAVPLFEATEDWRGLSHALDNLGGILITLGDLARAGTLYDRSLRLGEEIADKHAIATALRGLGGVASNRSDHSRATCLYEDSVARFRELNVGCAPRGRSGSLPEATRPRPKAGTRREEP